MMRSGVTALCLAVFLAVFEIGSCLRCYHCNSQADPNCVDPFKGKTTQLIDCSSPDSVSYNQKYLYNILPPDVFGSVSGAPRYCHKIVMDSGTVIRTCLDANPTNPNHTCHLVETVTATALKEKKVKSCSACDKEGCNGAGSIAVSLPLAALALITTLLYKQ